MIRSVNSAGECHLDVVEVVGSNPTRSREKKLLQRADSISFNRKAPDKRCFYLSGAVNREIEKVESRMWRAKFQSNR